MHFQNKRKGVAYLMCALMLSLSIMSAHTIPVEASTVNHASLYKLVDMSLSKTGIVANNDIINSISNGCYTDFTTAFQGYCDYLESTYGEAYTISVETLTEYLNTLTDTTAYCYELLKRAVENAYDIVNMTIEDFADLLLNINPGTGIGKGGAYTIADDAVEYIREKFDEYAETEADYYYIDTVGPDDVHPGWFPTRTSYEVMKTVISESPYPLIVRFTYGTAGTYFSTTSSNTSTYGGVDIAICDNGLFLVHFDAADPQNYLYIVSSYDNDWDSLTTRNMNFGYWLNVTFTNFEECYEQCTHKTNTNQVYSYLERTESNATAQLGICTNDGRQMKVFKDASTMKLYSVGQQPYYLVQNNDYSTTNDNSVKFDGTYYQNNSEAYSYDIVQNEIDNSTEINEETVNNIVNNSSTTIINNYYTESNVTDDDEIGTGDGNNGGTTDYDDEFVRAEISGLGGALIGIALEHYETIGNVAEAVHEGIQQVTDPINDTLLIVDDTMNNLKTTTEDLGNDLSEVSGFMQSLYSFIPDKVMNLLIAGSVASIGVGIWWSIRR